MSRIGRIRPAGTYQSSAALSERSSRDEPQDHELLPQPMIPKFSYSVVNRILLSVQNCCFVRSGKGMISTTLARWANHAKGRRESSG